MEGVGQLAGGIAHDFNNMLTAISGHIELARSRLARAGDSSSGTMPSEIEQAAARAAELTAATAGVRPQAGRCAAGVDLDASSAERSPMSSELVGAEVELVVELGARRVHGRSADPAQLEQVILNLVVNARDAMPPAAASPSRRDVELDAARPSSGPRASSPRARTSSSRSRDTGTGMDAETLERVFEPFFTTKAVGHGDRPRPLDRLRHRQAERWTIVADSAGGSGTTFRIYLPVASETVRPERGHGTR